MNREQYLLTCLMEECAEVQKACSKAIRFGLNDDDNGRKSTNKEIINDELIDLRSVVIMLQQEGCLAIPSWQQSKIMGQAKADKVDFYYIVSRDKGIVDK